MTMLKNIDYLCVFVCNVILLQGLFQLIFLQDNSTNCVVKIVKSFARMWIASLIVGEHIISV